MSVDPPAPAAYTKILSEREAAAISTTPRDDTQMITRLPRPLIQEIEGLAERHFRSFNQECLRAMAHFLATEPAAYKDRAWRYDRGEPTERQARTLLGPRDLITCFKQAATRLFGQINLGLIRALEFWAAESGAEQLLGGKTPA